MSVIVAENLIKTYGQGEALVEALRGMSFIIHQGEFVAVMGPSGSGKSTLLSVMGALNTPTSGTYKVNEIDIYALNSDQRADFRLENLGFVFQNFYLVNYLSLAENLMLPLATKKMKSKTKREMAEQALERVGLSGKANRLPSEVSGGEQERAAVARALVNKPPILLADEPTGNLDVSTSRELMKLLCSLNEDGMTIVMVTHSPECAAYASRSINMTDGRLFEDSWAPAAGLEPTGAHAVRH